MHRLLILVLGALFALAAPATAADTVQVVNEPARPVFVTNMTDYTLYGAAISGMIIVLAILLVLIWLQLGAIRAAAERQSPPPK